MAADAEAEQEAEATPRSRLLALAAIGAAVAGYAAMALVYAHVTPVGQGPDEVPHLAYARLIADHLALPGAGVQEKQQPPLAYLLDAVVLRAGGGASDVRHLSAVLGAGAVLLTALTARALWPARPWRWAGAAALVAAVPELQYLGGVVTDDTLAATVGALLCVLTATVLVGPVPGPRMTVACGAAAGFGLLTKETDFALVGILAAAVAYRRRSSLIFRDGLLACAACVAVCGWWYARNLASFQAPLPPLASLGNVHQHLRHIGQLEGFVSALLRSSVGAYSDGATRLQFIGAGGDSTLVVGPVLAAAGLVGLAGLVLARQAWPAWSGRERAVAVAAVAAPLALLVLVVGNSVAIDLQPQGRYLLPAAPLVACAAVWACAGAAARLRLAPAGRRSLVGAALAGAALLAAAGVQTERDMAATVPSPSAVSPGDAGAAS
ncbi:MAG TPA: hypothetical protein VFO60_01935 [Candidatus Dormibacteraeota bacterium]|nr:hypothetical protein [Candidatus Dormibacteraeota bacterium]